jgi:hypothetical protein
VQSSCCGFFGEGILLQKVKTAIRKYKWIKMHWSNLMPNLTVLINAFFENLINGRDPNEVMFNRTGCFDVGPMCGGWGHVQMEMRAEIR